MRVGVPTDPQLSRALFLPALVAEVCARREPSLRARARQVVQPFPGGEEAERPLGAADAVPWIGAARRAAPGRVARGEAGAVARLAQLVVAVVAVIAVVAAAAAALLLWLRRRRRRHVRFHDD